MTFQAKYRGRCYECGGPFSAGDAVRFEVFRDDEHLVHDACGILPTEFDRDAQREVCTNCFILKPCPCQDGV